MINDVKKYFSLMKYGYQFKTNLLLGLGFEVFGLVQLLFLYPSDANASTAIIMFMVGPACILQLVSTLEFANSVKVAPFFNKVYISFSKYINFASIIIVDIIYISIRFYQAKSSDIIMNSLGTEFFSCGILLIVLYIYMAIAYRMFIVGTIIFLPCLFSAMYMNTFEIKRICITANQGVLIMILCSAAAIILYEVFHRAVYKMPISRYSMGAFLRKYM